MKVIREDIIHKLENAVKCAAGAEYEVNFCEARKNNGVILKQADIRRPGKNVVQKIYINEILEMVTSGKAEVNEAAGMIMEICREREHDADNLERIMHGLNREEILRCITGQMVNKTANAEMLMETPHKAVLDLALVYRMILRENEYGTDSFLINHVACGRYGISFEELDSAASADMYREGFTTHTIGSMLEGSAVLPDGMPVGTWPMLVITNSRRLFGAAVMAHPDYFGVLSEKIGSDLYILPSSIHEVIAVPAEGIEPDVLRQIVAEVNATELKKEEFLSSNVYQYSRKKGELTIA